MFKMRLSASLYRFPFGGGSRPATKLARFASICFCSPFSISIKRHMGGWSHLKAFYNRLWLASAWLLVLSICIKVLS